ncbi:ExeM/NucH family extracellular endonuclease [Deinococcus sp. QL22]|uniref:ExeM/NucH family extracellular endonuclease n=1 Tax=Deinococcus sp. QL22 TaxID=2939437 RepID=UPI002018153A|nr:ExeM/NucH family extracellular endonuclease [Deinococcus sp. QL22]UQN06984.1 ExeM/NucH family extracellular endonuclease [Deinococcus sp. QL22]
MPTKRLILAGLLALTACGQPNVQTPAANQPNASQPSANQPGRAAPTSLGIYELRVTDATSATPTISVQAVKGLAPQATDVTDLLYTPLSAGTLTDEANRVRYLRASFRVKNTGTATLTAPTFVPVDTAGGDATNTATVSSTPFKDVKRFDGSPVPDARASALKPDTARELTYVGSVPTFAPDPKATPLVTGLNTGDLTVTLPAGLQVAGVAHQGWQSMSTLAPGAETVVTFATQIPMAATAAEDPFAFSLVFSATDNPGTIALNNIGAVQGSTPSGNAPSPLTGAVNVEGVVTSNLVAGTLRGFFVQEEGIDADNDVQTSDGVFIFCGSTGGNCPTLTTGDRVRVTGNVSEFVTATQISPASAADVTVLASGTALPAPQTLTLPLPVAERERFEGMLVTVSGTVTNNFTLGRGGSFDLADERLYTFSQINAPSVSGLAAFNANLPNRFIRIDDGTRAQNPNPLIFGRGNQPLSAANTLRGGDTATATGVLSYSNDGWTGSGSLDTYRIHATAASTTITATNPRQPVPEAVGGSLRVGSMNVLNYFTTLLTTNTGCTPNGIGSTARGANNCDEFLRQRAKTVDSIRKLNADVLGILEMQNDYAKGANSSLANLVNALNDPATGGTAGAYAYLNSAANIGTDAITVAMIYKPAAVTPVGNLAILDSTFDPAYIDTCNRPTLAQTFQSNANGGRFTAAMAHLKSKGSPCAGDTDQLDGQGASNATRLAAADVITKWLETNPTGVADADRILLGDLNAYRMEDPIMRLLRGADNTAGNADDLVSVFGPESYSYQFDGTWGSLDHAIVSQSLNGQLTGKTKWHINADEPVILDYNTEFKAADQQASFFAPDAFRSSDHDPVLVGLNLTADAPITTPIASLTLTPEAGSATVTVGGVAATQSFTASNVNASGPITVTVTPTGGAPAIVTVPATVASGAAFNATVSAPAGTAPGSYQYTITARNGLLSDSSTLNVTVNPAAAVAGGALVIRQVYGAGGNTGAPFLSDFVELFNRSKQPVSTAGMSVQYASAAGTFAATATASIALPTFNVQPGQSFLIRMSDGAGPAAALPTPDANFTGTGVAMSGTNGKVALVGNAVAITGLADPDVLDFVGYGSANAFEGSAAAPALSSTTAATRAGNGCTDANNNASDFAAAAPTPRNSASPVTPCP